MPLIQSKSKKALKKNIETEMDANPSKKKHDQNLAIAYSVQRNNMKKKMAQGGPVQQAPMPSKEDAQKFQKGFNGGEDMKKAWKNVKDYFSGDADKKENYAEGGEVCMHCSGTGHAAQNTNEPAMPEHSIPKFPHEVDDEIDSHMFAEEAHYADGGEIEDEDYFEDGKEGPGEDRRQNIGAKQFQNDNYNAEDEQPEDSNEHAVDLIDEDEHDRVSRIMKKMRG